MRMNVARDQVFANPALARDQNLAFRPGDASGSDQECSHLRVFDHEGIRIRDICAGAQEITWHLLVP